MNKQFLMGFICVFLLISIVSVYAAIDTDTVYFGMAGCGTTLPGGCPSPPPSYCPSSAPFTLIPNCSSCGCSDLTMCKNISCSTKPDECGCVKIPDNLKCNEGHDSDCNNFMGACYINESQKCDTCPNMLSEMVDCSYYKKQEICEQDNCFLGKRGFGVGFYKSDWLVVNYSCEWDSTANNNAGGCTLGYNTYDPITKKTARCKTTQKLGKCIDDKAELTWTKICTPGDEKSDGTSQIACGKAASPLPFFTSLNFVLALAIIFSYYLFARINGKSGG